MKTGIYMIGLKKICLGAAVMSTVLAIAGCATRSAIAPSAVGLPASEVATLRAPPPHADQQISCSFDVVFDERGQEVRRNNNFTESLQEIVVPSGRYEVVMKTPGAPPYIMSSFPRVYPNVQGGKVYEFACTKILDGRAVRAEFSESKLIFEKK